MKQEEDRFDNAIFFAFLISLLQKQLIIQLMSHDKKRILKEFEWFQVQTKVRQIISQIIHPLQKRVMSNSTSISKLQQITRDEKHKMQQITLMINNDEDIFKEGIFKNIEEKFQNQTILIRQLQHKIEYLQTYINSKAKILDQRLQESTEVLNGINDFKSYVKDEFNNQSKKIIDSHANVFENFDIINKEISAIQIQIDSLKSQHELSSKKIEFNETIVKEANHRLDEKLMEFYESIKEIKITTQINGGHVVHMRQQMLRMGAYEKILSKFESLVNEQIIRIDNLEFKIEVIQPVVSFTQINEYAHHILPEKYHKNISIYYYNRYSQLIQEILNNNFEEKRVSQSVKGNLQLIKQAHKRAIKLVFKLKKQQLMKKGINIQLLSHQKKEEHLTNTKLQQDFQGIDEGDPEITKKIVLESDAPKATSEQIEHIAKQLKEKIELELNDSKKYIQNMDYLLKRDQQNLQKNMNTLSNSLTQLIMNFQLQSRSYQQSSIRVDININLLKQEYRTLKLAMRQIHDIMLVFNQIQKQDEKDRQGITLLGVRQRQRDQIRQAYQKKIKRSVVGLQQECLSCSGNPNYYNQFFKMACLTYASSPIHYDNRVYDRIQILDKLQHQLQLIHHVLAEKGINEQQLGLETERRPTKQEQFFSQRYCSNQIMKLPSREASSTSDKYVIRNVSSSQQIRSRIDSKSPQQPRIIHPSELTNQILVKTRNRLFSRKFQRSIRQSQSKKVDYNHNRTEYMKNLSRHFKDLNKQNEGILKM